LLILTQLLTFLNSIIMKRTFKAIAAVIACVMVSSCATISAPIAATSNPVGSKCGVAESMVYLGIWDTNGAENGIEKAAKQAGITKISHVDSYQTSYFFGVVVKQTTKVYGE
jgi:hypothetical protein